MDTTSTAAVNGYNRFPQMRQETIQGLSDLNMQLYRQLGVVGPMARGYTNIPLDLALAALATPPNGNHTLSDVVVFMMNGLQTYHRLLVDIIGSTGPTDSDMYTSHGNAKPRTLSTSPLSPAEGVESEDSGPRRRMSESAGRPPRKRSRSDGDAALITACSSSNVLHDWDSSHSPLFDMPTSLLLLSCHTNLMHLCRDAFAAIRAALLARQRHITFFTISILHTDEVSMPADPDLQIIVLTQAVIRLIDRIGRLLGHPGDCEGGVDSTGASGGEISESRVRSCAIPHQLVNLVLRGEESGEGPAHRIGIEALRDEMRRLHEIVYLPV